MQEHFSVLFQACQSPIAQAALNRIAKLYAVEADSRNLSIAERKQLAIWLDLDNSNCGYFIGFAVDFDWPFPPCGYSTKRFCCAQALTR